MLSLGDLYTFVQQNKTDKSFVGYTDTQILDMLLIGIQNHTLYYTTDQHNNISGMILATVDADQNILFIDENLAMNKTNLRLFATKAKEQFNGLNLMWRKHGIYKQPNTDKVYAKLSQ